MRHTAAGLTFEHHGPLEGNHYRVMAISPEDKVVGMHEYKVSDQGLHPSEPRGRFPDVDRAMHEEMQRRHPGLPVVEKTPPPAEAPEPEPETWYHGTVTPKLRHILPADKHGRPVTFASDTDRGHAYATSNVDDAWEYAHKAWSAHPSGRPRVYAVQPAGHYEKDPETDAQGRMRGNNSSDYRSRDGWKVTRELRMPSHMGRPSDWDS